jgi:aminoglycoside phosphotransferase (APT) family kinase protein
VATADELEARLGGRVDGLRRLSGGASRETWSFDLHREDRVDELILRRDPPGAAKGGMTREAALLRAAASVGVPVPEVIDADESSMVMTRIAGETIPRKILRDAEYANARPLLAAQCGEILARLHTLPADAVEGLEQQDQIAQWRGTLDALGQPHPAFELAFRWLEANRPTPPLEPTVVHGDFRNGNLIVGGEGVRAVLDWELAHAGDPLEDLGWLCVKSWRFGIDLPVGGFGTYDELVGAYESVGDGTVDRDALRWWEVVGTLKWGIMCILQTTAHVGGMVRSVELAAIGRRVCEVEWDLLEVLPA